MVRHIGVFSTTLLLALAISAQAKAQSIIKRPGDHPDYIFEAEPHLIVRDRRGHAGTGFGPGFRGTIVIVDNGFIGKINNSVGIGFGLDWLVFGDDHCHGPRRNPDFCHDHHQVITPVVLQWNFWLHERWSVFGEPGFALVFNTDDDDELDGHDHHDGLDFDPFVFYAGGRFHFNETVALTMRLGFPLSASIGCSFLL